MPALLLALALTTALQAAPAETATETGTAPSQGAVVTGAAPTDAFGLVSWCAGATEGYLKLKPDILPEVERIEGQFRRPGSSLAEDMKDYADMERDARRQMVVFQTAIQAGMKASAGALDEPGRVAYRRGLAVWAAPGYSTKARIAQEWMSWSLPSQCETTATALATKASLLGEALKPTDAVPDAAAPAPETTATAPEQAVPPSEAAAAPADSAAAPSAPPIAEAAAQTGDTTAAAPVETAASEDQGTAAAKPAAKPSRKAAPARRKPTPKPRA